MTKDLKDYQGDLMNGVRTVFTVFGKKRGKKIVSICLGLSLLTPVMLFHGINDIAFLLLAASLTSMFFYLRERLIITYLGYGAVSLYCLIKITGYI
jgi:4-hydroxybenzoate polyprenyltransferase